MDLPYYLFMAFVFLYPVLYIYVVVKISRNNVKKKRNSIFLTGIIIDTSQVICDGSLKYIHYYQDIVVEYFYNGMLNRQLIKDIVLNYSYTNALGRSRTKGFNINDKVDIYVCSTDHSVHLVNEEHNFNFMLFVTFGAFFLLDLFFIGLAIHSYFIRGEAFF